jgi:uncharacterized protein YcbX
MITVESLHIYPVKSCRGIDVEEAEVVATGFRHDREWMVIDQRGVFLSQREHPSLARVTTRLDPVRLTLHAPDLPPLTIPLDRSTGECRPVTIWNDTCEAKSEGIEAAQWFSAHLATACQLVRLPGSSTRSVDPDFSGSEDLVAFADGFPFLLINRASVEDLNHRLESPIPADRFRANIIIAGADPYTEDGWSELEIGSVGFRAAKPCARCVVITTDQHDGSRGVEPLATLAGYRRRGTKVLFGQNLVHRSTGTLRVGAAVRVLTQQKAPR